jgi:hypothetical protein
MPTYRSIAAGLICSLLIVAGVFSTPLWEFGPFGLTVIALLIMVSALKGKTRFKIAMGLTSLSVVLSVTAMVMYGTADESSFNLASFDSHGSHFEELTFSYQWLEEMSSAKYWELILNGSIAVMIMTATFCLLVPNKDA